MTAAALAAPAGEPTQGRRAAPRFGPLRGSMAATLARLTTPADPHRDWLRVRNELLAIINDDAPMPEAVMDALSGAMTDVEEQIVATPARTADGIIAKMTYALEVAVEGFEIDQAQAASMIVEVIAITGMGSLAGASFDIQQEYA